MRQPNVYSMPHGRTMGFVHKHPERTASRHGLSWDSDITFKVWSSREAMAKAIRRNESSSMYSDPIWKALVPMRETEGYN